MIDGYSYEREIKFVVYTLSFAFGPRRVPRYRCAPPRRLLCLCSDCLADGVFVDVRACPFALARFRFRLAVPRDLQVHDDTTK